VYDRIEDVMNLSWRVFAMVVVLAAGAGACGSSTTGGSDAAAGTSAGGTTGRGGTTGSAGSTGNAGTIGSGGRGGTTGSAGTTGRGGATGAGGSGTQPIGAACANTGNCSQADGATVCCVQISTCVLQNQCPTGTNYIPCSATNPCMSGGWICCMTPSMNYCTKQSGCPAP
jgi:hypothetical protein